MLPLRDEDHSWRLRLVSGSRAEELKDAAPCDVMIHKGGDS